MTVYPVRWRLLYADGRVLDEKADGNSILERWANPETLCLIDIVGTILVGIPIPNDARPIFYRNRSTDFAGNLKTDAIIFGYGKSGNTRFEGKLWEFKNGQAKDCPQEHIAIGAIELQVS